MFAVAVGKVKFKLSGGQCSVPVYLSNNVSDWKHDIVSQNIY